MTILVIAEHDNRNVDVDAAEQVVHVVVDPDKLCVADLQLFVDGSQLRDVYRLQREGRPVRECRKLHPGG